MLHRSTSIDEDPRWQVLITGQHDGHPAFFYGVKSTGIYCRSDCTSRRPKPENVVFFDSPALAEKAGYRACKRCKPAQADPQARDIERIAQACKRILTADETPSLAELADEAGLSPWHFQKLFKARVGVTPKQFAHREKTRRFQAALAQDGTVTGAIYEAGYGSSSRAYEKSKAQLGMAPSAYKKGGRGQEIAYGCMKCYLGWVLVAQTDKGICAIELGNGAEELAANLQERFPQAILRPAGADFAQNLQKIVAFLQHPKADPGLPLDIQGTAFQQRVWQALRQIPAGQTASYKEVAHIMGQPNAARAVARACAANPLAVVVPCHRVVRENGDLSGYRWGVERKKALLAKEQTLTREKAV